MRGGVAMHISIHRCVVRCWCEVLLPPPLAPCSRSHPWQFSTFTSITSHQPSVHLPPHVPVDIQLCLARSVREITRLAFHDHFQSHTSHSSPPQLPHESLAGCLPKPARAHHCSVCGTCQSPTLSPCNRRHRTHSTGTPFSGTLRMDHHCPFIGNCVGLNNHRLAPPPYH